MAIDLRRCAEAAAQAALAEAFAPPEPKRRRRSRRRLRPVRTVLMGVGLVTTVRVALSPELRRTILEAVAERLPLEDWLDELVLDADVVPDADDGDAQEGGADEAPDEAEGAQAGAQRASRHPSGGQRRRNVSRSRGDTNGRGGRKPPNRGTRA